MMCDNWLNGFCTIYGMRCRYETNEEQLDCEDYSEYDYQNDFEQENDEDDV